MAGVQPSEILNFSFLGNIIGKYIEKYIERCSIHVKISWGIKKTKARPSAAPPRGAAASRPPPWVLFSLFPMIFLHKWDIFLYILPIYFPIFFYIFSYIFPIIYSLITTLLKKYWKLLNMFFSRIDSIIELRTRK